MKQMTDPQEKIARISDILEQIDKLNGMIDFHKFESKETSMQQQYEQMKDEFLFEFEELLSDFRIDMTIKRQIAA
jgi:TolA-binding protein